jgi:hypothetical protein
MVAMELLTKQLKAVTENIEAVEINPDSRIPIQKY